MGVGGRLHDKPRDRLCRRIIKTLLRLNILWRLLVPVKYVATCT